MVPRLSVRQSLLLVALVSIVPAIAIIVGTGIEHAQTLERGAAAEAHRHVESIVGLQAQRDESVAALLRTLATLPAFSEGTTDEQLVIMERLLAANDDILNISVTDEHGLVTASPGLTPGTDLSNRQHVRVSLSTGRFTAGEFIIAYVGSEPALPYSCPIFAPDGTLRGSISVVYPVSDYAAVFANLALPDGSILGITDRNGIRLFFSPPMPTNPIGAPIKTSMWRRISTGPGTGTVRAYGSDGVRRTYAYQRIRDDANGTPRFYVVLGIPETESVGVATRILVRNLILMVALVLVTIAVAVGLGGFVIGSRIDRLAAAAQQISTGDLTTRVGLDGDATEIGRVARAIDAMAESLQERQRLRQEQHTRLEASLREKEVLLQEVHHRVKNNMLLISSLVSLQRTQVQGMDEFCTDLEARIRAISSVHEQLYQSPDLASIHIRQLLSELTQSIAQVPDAGQITITGDDPVLAMKQAIPVALIANELMVNAVKHAPPDRPSNVTAALLCVDDGVQFTVTDSGNGFPEGFDPAGSNSLGMRLIVALAAQLDADLEIGNTTQGGGRVALTIPVPAAT